MIGGKYIVDSEIANGGCGTVYLGTHHIAGKPVAIKLEPTIPQAPNGQPANPYMGPSPLTLESQIYKRLMGGPGVPWCMYSGRQGDYNVMVIDLLGQSLEDLFKMCNRCFSLKTVLLLADQIVRVSFHIIMSCIKTDVYHPTDITHRVHSLPLTPPPRRQARQLRHGHRQSRAPG